MIKNRIEIVLSFVLFVLLQVMILNNIHLFRIISPLIYIYVILKLPVDMSRVSVIFISFLLGLAIDICSNTFGMHAAACSLVGLVRASLLYSMIDIKEIPEGSIPSFGLMGFTKFMRYALILISIHIITLFAIESFNFFQPFMLIIKIVSSIALSTLLIGITEAFNPGTKRHDN